MRRVSVHAITVVAVSIVAVAAVATGLAGSPQQATVATAEPPAGSTLIPQPVRSVAAAVEEAARSVRTDSRSKDRVALAATKATKAAAVERQLVLTAEGKSIASRQSVIVRQRAELRRQRAAAEAKRKKAIAKRGYLPGTTNPREIAKQILKNKYGYGPEQYSCFNNIIMRESMWRINASNASSGAYGIPQALPGSKMGTIAPDWRTNPATQIIWGIDYMKGRYGSPCGAWGFKSSHGWY